MTANIPHLEAVNKPTPPLHGPYLQHISGQRDVRRRWGPLQPEVGAVDDAGRLGPRRRAAAVVRTRAAVPGGSVPLRPVRAPSLQAAERHEQTGEDAEPRRADAMFSLGYSQSISTRHSSLASHRPWLVLSPLSVGRKSLRRKGGRVPESLSREGTKTTKTKKERMDFLYL